MRYGSMEMKVVMRKSKWIVVSVGIAMITVVVAQFVVPHLNDRLRAVGSLAGLDSEMKTAFTNEGEFSKIPVPGSGDWLAQHEEKGQTYSQYLRYKPNPITRGQRVLYIQPMGEFTPGKGPSIQVLREYTEAYYYPLKVVVRPVIQPKGITSRVNGGQIQWLTTDILDTLQNNLPHDAYSMLGVTMTDLYPEPSWNFVFGQARTKARVGIFSFARYRPDDDDSKFEKLDMKQKAVANQAADQVMLRRAAKVLTHETGHMFGVRHCIHYHCNMNGANNLQEADSTPMHLCPVCLRKMQYTIKFSPEARYKKLLAFYRKYQLDDELKWVQARLQRFTEEK